MQNLALVLLALLRPCAPSGADHILREGTLQPGAVAAPPRLVFVHIPRAAGGSSMNAAPSVLPKGTTLLGSAESAAWSRLTRERLGAGGGLVTMLRFPLSLALSQFLYCKFQLRRRKGRGRFPNRDPGRPRAPTGGLDEWAAHFPADTSYGCYDPTNVQYRFVAGNGNARGATARRMGLRATPRSSTSTGPTPLSRRPSRPAAALVCAAIRGRAPWATSARLMAAAAAICTRPLTCCSPPTS